MHSSPLPYVAGLTLLLGAVACSPGGSPEAAGHGAPSGGAEAPIPGALERTRKTKVQVAPLARHEMVRSISAIVNAASAREIEVFPRTSGVVVELLVEEGDRVAAGAPLLGLDPRELETALAEARIAEREAVDAIPTLELAVDEAEARLERARLTKDQAERELARKEAVENVLSRNELDQLRLSAETAAADLAAEEVAVQRARTAVTTGQIAIDRARNQVAKAELDLSFATVRAPFAGVIARRDVEVGDLVSNATVSFLLSDVDDVRAVVSRPQRELTFFHAAEKRMRSGADDANLEITLEPDALPGESYDGRILFVSPTIDPASGQFRVTLGVEQPSESEARPPLLPGMQVRVRIVTERHPDALVVPKRALVREGDADFVFVIEDDVARRVRIEEGFTTDDTVEVFAAEGETLEAGAKIVVIGNRDLEDGAAVESDWWAGAEGVPVEENADGEESSVGETPEDTTDAEPASATDAPNGATTETSNDGTTDDDDA